MKGFQKLISVDDALQTFLGKVKVTPRRTSAPIDSALRRVLAEDLVAKTDLPRADRSAVDGYAVDYDSTTGATQSDPKILRLVKEASTKANQAKQIWTGNPIPEGANAVVMLEDTKPVGEEIEVWSPVTRWENVSRRGEDIRRGDVAVEAGTRLKPQHLGLAAALGIVELDVFERPTIGILATGNELAELGSELTADQIFDSNRYALSAMAGELGAETVDLGIARDNVGELSGKMKMGLETADLVITSGGTSVGGLDLVPETVNKMGKPGVIVHGVAMRPGMPIALAIVGEKPIVILPGNPVAAMLGFDVFVRPLISRMLGLRKAEPRPMLKARMARSVTTALGRRSFVRVRVFQEGNDFLAEPISVRGSSLMSTMTKANGYVMVSERREGLRTGDAVFAHMFDDLEVISGDV